MNDLYRDGLFGQTIYSPWFDNEGGFSKVYSDYEKVRTVVSPDRVYIIYSCLKHILHSNVFGDIWECGVYKGGTARVISNLLKLEGETRRLRLFDTFTGMPDEIDLKYDSHREGDFPFTNTTEVLNNVQYDNLELHEGVIPHTFKGREKDTISFVHIDVDVYKTTLACCEFCWDRLSYGGIMVIDDYGFPMTKGCKEAVDKFFAKENAFPIILPTGQALGIKT